MAGLNGERMRPRPENLGTIMSQWGSDWFLHMRVCHLETMKPSTGAFQFETSATGIQDLKILGYIIIDEYYKRQGYDSEVILKWEHSEP